MVRFFLKVFALSFAAILFSWFFEGAFYTYHYSRANTYQSDGGVVAPRPALLSAIQKDFNFLLLGMSGIPYPAPYLTDTIIAGSVRVRGGGVNLFSLPRDLLVKVPGGTNWVKINSLYEIGKSFSPLEPEYFVKEKVEEITGLPIDYVAVIDVKGLETVIDFLGGVDMEVKNTITDPFFPGPNYSYEPFYLEEGMRHLSGHDAVRFARSRYTPRGDFERIERQQNLIKALRERIAAAHIPFGNIAEVFSRLQGHLITNIVLQNMPSLLSFMFADGEHIESHTIGIGREGALLKEGKGKDGAYILAPKKGAEDYSEIQKFISEKMSFTIPSE